MRHVLAILLAFATALAVVSASAAPTLRVKGGSAIRLLALDRGNDVLVRGQITDDVGATLGRVTLQIGVDGGPVVAAGKCPDSEGGVFGAPRLEKSGYAVVTDERGYFCLQYPRPGAGVTFRASFVGNNHFEGGSTEAKATPESEQRAETLLRFEPVPGTVDLDRPSATVTLALRIERNDATQLSLPGARREGLPVELFDERGSKLAEGATGGDGKARLEIETKKLGIPGNGELVAKFPGTARLTPSQATAYLSREATVTLSAPERAKGDPEQGIPIDVEVSTAFGPVTGGVVEATTPTGESVGAGQVEDGRAHVLVTFVGGAAASVPLKLSYVPSAPFWKPGEPARVEVLAEGPSLLRQGVLAIVGLALAGWIVAKWRRAPKPERSDSILPPPPSGRPEMVVVERPSGLRGWRGIVTDAHEGFPIEGAELTIVVQSLEGRDRVASAFTDIDGRFVLEVQVPRDARLVVEGDVHAPYEQLLPGPSVLRIALVTRRRALLDRLVKWARTRGTPFDSHREPTPGHVRRAANRAGVPRVEAWARHVERAAFGPDVVTRSVQESVSAEEPGAARPFPAPHEDARQGEGPHDPR